IAWMVVLSLGTVTAVGVMVGGVARLAQEPADKTPAVARPVERQQTRRDLFGDPLPEGAVARLGTVRFNHGDSLATLHFLPDGKTILSEGNGIARLWNADTGEQLGEFPTAKPFIDETVLTPDGKTLVSHKQDGVDADTVHFWD